MSSRAWRHVRCPTCGAAPGRRCQTGNGRPANQPHLSRHDLAIEYLWSNEPFPESHLRPIKTVYLPGDAHE